ncbi:hypothetical protein PoB_001746800 [Plakobranchus ocellatus]|uniref:Uncharacterized protein n=1 Tax=Plakobranchus ocellatus TaxID=259542 RepID=A0AAV3Z890_9GAST|nr:hypothetical protein PoB_001746800 [Plakobranchus ocellatus]
MSVKYLRHYENIRRRDRNLAPEDCTYAWNIFTRPHQANSPTPRKVHWRQLRRPQEGTLFDPDCNNFHRSSPNSRCSRMESRGYNRSSQPTRRKAYSNLCRFVTVKKGRASYSRLWPSRMGEIYFDDNTTDSYIQVKLDNSNRVGWITLKRPKTGVLYDPLYGTFYRWDGPDSVSNATIEQEVAMRRREIAKREREISTYRPENSDCCQDGYGCNGQKRRSYKAFHEELMNRRQLKFRQSSSDGSESED